MHCIKRTRLSFDNDVKQFYDDDKTDEHLKCKSRSPIPTDASGSTPLHDAVTHNNLELLQSLVDSAYDINVEDSFGSSPLLLASIFNRFDAINLLLEKNADVFVTDSSGRSILEILLGKLAILPLKVIAKLLNILINCKLDVVSKTELLVKANCDLKFVLHLKNTEITRVFLKCKSHITEEESALAMEYAMDKLDLENVQVFLNFESEEIDWIDTFIRKLVDLSMPGQRRNLQAAKVFLETLDTLDFIGEDLIDYFCLMFSFGDKDLLELLWQCNIHVLIKQKFELDLVAHMFENRNINICEFFSKNSERQFDVNAKGEDGLSALHFAVRGDSEKNVRFLLDLGASINMKNDRGWTSLLEAVAYDRKRILRILLQYGADINAVVHDKFTVFDPFEESFCTDMQQFFIAQLTLNETLGVPIVDSVMKRINKNKKCSKFYEDCRLQIELLKKVEIWKSFSLFTPIEGDLEKIACHVQDSKTAQMLEEQYRQRKIHPYYYSTLRYKLVKAFEWQRDNLAAMVISDGKVEVMDIKESTKENVNAGSVNVNGA